MRNLKQILLLWCSAACLLAVIAAPAIVQAQAIQGVQNKGVAKKGADMATLTWYGPYPNDPNILTQVVRNMDGLQYNSIAGGGTVNFDVYNQCGVVNTYTVTSYAMPARTASAPTVFTFNFPCEAAPAAPTAAPTLSAPTVTAGLVKLKWTAPAGTVTGYTLQTTKTGSAAQTATLGNVLAYDSAATCAPYSFRIAATNVGGTGPWSNTVSTACPCSTAPAAPTSFSVKQTGATCSAGVDVTIVPGANPACVASYSLVEGTTTTAVGSGTVFHRPMDNNVTHSWTIKASNSIGVSAASPTVQYTCRDVPSGWTATNYQAVTDIAAGSGKVWYINGETIYQVTASGPVAVTGAAVKIAVDHTTGIPWVVNKAGAIYKWTGTTWANVPGTALDIAVAPNGVAWILRASDGLPVYWTGTAWQVLTSASFAATRISVGPNMTPWLINSTGGIFKWNGSAWQALPGAASDISVGPDGTVYMVGDKNQIYRWNGSNWSAEAGAIGPAVAAGAGLKAWLARTGATVVAR